MTLRKSYLGQGALRMLRRHWPLLIPLAFGMSVFRAWLEPGLLIGDDQFRFSHDVLSSYFPWRNAWDGSFIFGVSSAASLPANPLWSLVGALARTGLDFATIERLAWFWPLLACLVIAPYALSYRLTRSPWAASLASAVFAVNTWTVSLVQRGHIGSLVAYSLMPFAVLACSSLLRRRSALDAVYFSALVTLQIIYDLRYAYITIVLCAIWAASYAGRSLLRRRALPLRGLARALGWALVALLVFNAYWLVPQLIAPARFPAGYDTLRWYVLASSYQSLGHALALFYPFYHYVQGTPPFAVFPVELIFWVLPVAVAAALWAAKRRPWAVAFGLAGLIGVVVSSGPQSPFGSLNEFAFLHVPGMKLFRDASKFMSLIAFAYAFALALGFARLAAWVRLRFGKSKRFIAGALACGGIAAYVALMHDAYNPIRFSNFATTRLSQADVDMQRFLDKQPGYFRTLLFPTWRPELVGTDAHPIVSADYLVQSAQQDGGVAELFPDWQPLLSRWSSPIVPALLSEAQVRYVVVMDDPTGDLYEPFAYGVQYAQSVEFFRKRYWLRERARFGRYIVFTVVLHPAPRAFFARSPVTVFGKPESLVALVGSRAWGDRPAAVNAADSYLGPGLLAPPPRTLGYGWMMASNATNDVDSVYGSFSNSRAARVTAWVNGEPHALPSPVKRLRMRKESELAPAAVPAYPLVPTSSVTVEIRDPGVVSAPFDNPPDGAAWLGIAGLHADIELINWNGSALDADITLRVRLPDRAARTIEATLRSERRDLTIEPKTDCLKTSCAFTLQGMRLEPGLNVLGLRVRIQPQDQQVASGAGYSLVVADKVQIQPRGGIDPPGAAKLLRGTAHATNDGLDVSLRGCCRSLDYGRAAFALFGTTLISLAQRPTITLTYRPPPNPARMALFLELRQRTDGRRVEFVHAIPSAATIDSLDISESVQTALDEGWREELARRASGLAWYRAHRGNRPEASAYDLVATRLVIAGPAGLGAAYTARFFDARLDVAAGPTPDFTPRYLDLRRSVVTSQAHKFGAGNAFIVLRDSHSLRVSANPNSSSLGQYRIELPADDDARAAYAVFWLRLKASATFDVSLAFATPNKMTSRVLVAAAGRPSLTDPDAPIPSAWQAETLHVKSGEASLWRRLVIDLGDVKAYRLAHDGEGFGLSAIRIDVHSAVGSPARNGRQAVELSDAALMYAVENQRPHEAPDDQEVMIDGKAMSILRWRQMNVAGNASGNTSAFMLPAGNHRISVEPTLPLRATSLFLSAGVPSPTLRNQTEHFAALSPSEYVCEARGEGGLLVFAMSYAPGWQLFMEPLSSPKPSGVALIDAVRFRSSRPAQGGQVLVNGAFNGWFLPPGNARLVFFYAPEAASQLGALVWLVLSLSTIAAAVRFRVNSR